jgi:LysR family transcriptional regulator, nitrogen assimilation regulatory protein
MDLRQIMYFMCAYEERSITKAARKVGLVQPALSIQIKRLEDEFGGALFVRQRGGIDPTALGMSFYKLCQPIRTSIVQAQQSMRDLQRPDQVFGTLRCGFPPSYLKAGLGPVLADFVQRHPGVDLTVRESYGGTLRRWVADGELDFAFGSSPQLESGLADIAVFEEDLALVSGAPLAGDRLRPCDVGAITDLKLMLPSSQHLLGPILREHIATGVIRPKRTMVVDSYLGVLEIARASDWAAFIPVTGLLEEVSNPDLFIYPIARPFLTFRWHVSHQQSKPLTAAARLLIDATIAALTTKRVAWDKLCRQYAVNTRDKSHGKNRNRKAHAAAAAKGSVKRAVRRAAKRKLPPRQRPRR